ncbi:MAG: hypothetical protein LQ340_006914 [Diploschistes diacapsis]|nr:MAG: hypothetical protein LQ340_006914 [Diploschistes diacapsis]
MPHSSGNLPEKPTPRATSSAVAPLRSVQSVVLGETLFKAWYPSFYPEELAGPETERLYICQWCFKYAKDVGLYLAHTKHCDVASHPPGEKIYAKAPFSVHEVDGEQHKIFAQNLSLFAKLFLDNKSVFFDVLGFNYYLLMRHPTPASSGPAFPYPVGFFSKEKMSWDNNNLACILVFPPWQRQGLGKILMGVSYELSKREGRVGGPEKPLSELGRKSYLRFWQARVAREVLRTRSKSSLELAELAGRCAMVVEDAVAALKEMGVCEVMSKTDRVGVSKVRVREWAAKSGLDLSEPVEEKCFVAQGVAWGC